jgi:hypothetical protein
MLQIYVVFHKYIFDECYSEIPQDILNEYFTFIAVNNKIEKQYTPNKYKVIKEWELPIYDNTFQEFGYNENSAIYHIYKNKLHQKYSYIGFFQYDMKFNNQLDNILHLITENPIYFPLQIHDFNFCTVSTWNEPTTLDFIIDDYNKYFQTSFSKQKQYPLCNSYIIPVDTYEKVMGWVVQLYDKLYPWCIQSPNASHFGHIGGIYERIMAFAIGEEDLPYHLINMEHDHSYKKQSY